MTPFDTYDKTVFMDILGNVVEDKDKASCGVHFHMDDDMNITKEWFLLDKQSVVKSIDLEKGIISKVGKWITYHGRRIFIRAKNDPITEQSKVGWNLHPEGAQVDSPRVSTLEPENIGFKRQNLNRITHFEERDPFTGESRTFSSVKDPAYNKFLRGAGLTPLKSDVPRPKVAEPRRYNPRDDPTSDVYRLENFSYYQDPKTKKWTRHLPKWPKGSRIIHSIEDADIEKGIVKLPGKWITHQGRKIFIGAKKAEQVSTPHTIYNPNPDRIFVVPHTENPTGSLTYKRSTLLIRSPGTKYSF
jgi:hypothetical protein